MNKYYQNTFLFISHGKTTLKPLLNALRWALKHREERLDVALKRIGIFTDMLTDSYQHLIINYDMYQHLQTKEYILRLHTESKGNTHPIDLEYCRVHLSPDVKLHYISEGCSQRTYINTDLSHVYLPIRFKLELYINETYSIKYFINLMTLKQFLTKTFPTLYIDIFDGFKAVRSKINRYIKLSNANNWCHLANYESK